MKPIAYFSPEYAFDDLPIFAGGLGVLATDFLREAAENDLPYIGVGLYYRYGFSPVGEAKSNELDIKSAGWEEVKTDGEPLRLSVLIGGDEVEFGAWCKSFGNVTMYLLDCNLPHNPDSQREITSFLYHEDFEVKFKQNILLGVGGVKLLEELGVTPQLYHLNEGHTAFVSIALMAQHRDRKPHATFEELQEAVTAQLVATKHTVLSGAGMYISHNTFMNIFEDYLHESALHPEKVFALGQDPLRKDEFTTTRLMLTMARKTNAVSRSHSLYEDKLHPGSDFDLLPITNGINLKRWQHEEIGAAESLKDMWLVHSKLRSELIEHINSETGSQLDPDALTVVWARRITAYKRPLEIFKCFDCLERILCNLNQPIQIVIAGKPNIEDEVGVDMARQIGENAMNPRFDGRIAYLQQYNLGLAQKLVKGADVWLNTPEKGYEASGTSGMKAAANGVLQCSVSDGWVDEVDASSAGWVLPEINTSDTIYGFLEHEIAPRFYERDEEGIPSRWLKYMKSAIDLIFKDFTTARMLEEYRQHLYHIGSGEDK